MSATMEDPATKRCAKCGEVKGLEAFAHKYWCRECTGEYNRCWYAANLEKAKDRRARWEASNPEKVKAKRARARRRYYAKNRERIKDQSARYYVKNREAVLVKAKARRARQKAIRQFFRMHAAMRAISETLNNLKDTES